MQTQNFSSEAWLCRGISTVPGELKLEDGRLSYTAFGFGTILWFQRGKLEREAHQPGLADRMRRGENSVVFDARMTDVETEFPWYDPGGLRIRVGEAKYRIVFSESARVHHKGNIAGELIQSVFIIQKLTKAMRLWKAWKDTLREQIR
jgi:hypothetical protein